MRILALFALILAFSFDVEASGRPRSWSVSETASAKCVVPTTPQEADQILKQAEIKTSGLTADEKLTLAAALKTINTHGGPSMNGAFRNLNFSVQPNLRGTSGREIAGYGGSSFVRLNRSVFTMGRTSRTNAYAESTITHELGHTLANRRGLYSKYNRAVPQKCQVSNYCTHRLGLDGNSTSPHRSRNEEFAEVFAAYFYNPQGLAQQCPAAYKFLNTQVFKKTDFDARQTANTCTQNPFQRAYQRTDGQYVPVSGAQTAPTRGAPMYFSLGDLFRKWFSPRTLNMHGDGSQDQEDKRMQDLINRNTGSKVGN